MRMYKEYIQPLIGMFDQWCIQLFNTLFFFLLKSLIWTKVQSQRWLRKRHQGSRIGFRSRFTFSALNRAGRKWPTAYIKSAFTNNFLCYYIVMKFKELRLRASMSQRKLSVASGVAYPTICNIERGKHRPHFKTLSKLAKALGVKPNSIDLSTS